MTELVPFGKYKGQPIAKLLSDSKYCDWLKNQPDMTVKYPIVYNFILGINPKDDQPTPEHNKLQNKFLDRGFIESLLRFIFKDEFTEMDKYYDEHWVSAEKRRKYLINKYRDTFIQKYVQQHMDTKKKKERDELEECLKEFNDPKLNLLPLDLIQDIDEHFNRYKYDEDEDEDEETKEGRKKEREEIKLKISKEINEGKDIFQFYTDDNNKISFKFDGKEENYDIKYLYYRTTFEPLDGNDIAISSWTYNIGDKTKSGKDLRIEIKTNIGDDYPCILRKMKERRKIRMTKDEISASDILLIDSFKAEHTSIGELRKIFYNEYIQIVFFSEIDNKPNESIQVDSFNGKYNIYNVTKEQLDKIKVIIFDK